jgi:hypothetical protein
LYDPFVFFSNFMGGGKLLNPPMRPWLFMEDRRRKERREKREDPNPMGDISLLESPRKNVGTTKVEHFRRDYKEEKKEE